MSYLAAAFTSTQDEKALNIIDLLKGTTAWGGTWSGKTVNARTALEVATVAACTRVIGEGIAQVPLKLMQESKDGKSRHPAREEKLYNILANRPNPWQTSFEYREMLSLHVVLTGNHFSFINRSNRSGIMELIPFEPGNVTVKRASDYKLTYEVRGEGGHRQEFPAAAIWHVRGPSWNSWLGLEGVKIARQAIGLSMAIEEAQAKFQKNSFSQSGVYSVDGTLKDEQYRALKKWIDDYYTGPDNAGGVMVLDHGAKFLETKMKATDAQTLETRKYQVEEICRHFRVNPIMVGAESKNTTYASAEQMFLAHLIHTLAPWYTRLEQSINARLLTQAQRDKGIYANFVEEGLLRGSAIDTRNVILGYVNGGIMTVNEGRAKLDMNPDQDPDSDKLRIPVNVADTPSSEATK